VQLQHCARFFLQFPQGNSVVHSFRTKHRQFSIAAKWQLPQSASRACVKCLACLFNSYNGAGCQQILEGELLEGFSER
jgi:hypothetical protein